MNEDLFPYYDDELRFMREIAGEFAAANPKIAGRLRLSNETVEDPHVERLIQAFSFLNARIRMKLDDMFPELTDALLGTLYPHLLEPFPSSTIMEFRPSPDLDVQVSIPANSNIETEPVEGESCTYSTSYDVDLAPIQLMDARIFGRPLPGPKSKEFNATHCLRLRLECIGSDKTFTDLSLPRLRFYISAETRLANILYELVFNNTVQVVLAEGENDESPRIPAAYVYRWRGVYV